jgi:hypothetical protein
MFFCLARKVQIMTNLNQFVFYSSVSITSGTLEATHSVILRKKMRPITMGQHSSNNNI